MKRLPIYLAVSAILWPVSGYGQERMDIQDYVRQVFIEGVPYVETTNLYSASDVPALIAMLGASAEEAHWANIVVVLGMVGDEPAVDGLISFVGTPVQATLSPEHQRARNSAIMSLGYLVNRTKSQKALDYLVESLDPGIWGQRGISGASPFEDSAEGRDRELSKYALLGLALAGTPEASAALRSLRDQPSADAQQVFRNQVGDLLDEALKTHQTIAASGLAEYYRNAQQPPGQ